jgi:SAM-dependent methyltransferase
MLQQILNEFLNAYWLRPETALWRTVDAITMHDAKIYGRSLDFGCGDGINSFIKAGGTFKKTFDVFKGTGNLEQFFENEDIYNYPITNYIKINDSPSSSITVGFDHKKALLDKAEKLNFYKELILGDGNKTLPFKNNEFDSIFSDIVYWLNDLERVLSELHRITKPGGSVYLFLPDQNLLKASLYYNYQVKKKVKGYEFLKYLDRGRVSDNIKQARTEQDYFSAIKNAGFKVSEHKKHLSVRLLSIWDVGLRPIFPALNNACSRMSESDRIKFKDDMINTIKIFAEPLIDLEVLDKSNDKCFNYFHLKK